MLTEYGVTDIYLHKCLHLLCVHTVFTVHCNMLFSFVLRIRRTGTTTDIQVSPTSSPARSVTHSVRPQSPVQEGGNITDVETDVSKGKQNISGPTPTPPMHFGEYCYSSVYIVHKLLFLK